MIEIIITALLISLIFAPLGCLAVWKKYTYFGEGLAHASILAGVLGGAFDISLLYTGIIITILFALAIFKFRFGSGNNAAIGLTSSIMIAIALIISNFYPGVISINNLLFGDIISANMQVITTLSILLIAEVIFFIYCYRDILLLVLSREIAYSRGIKVAAIELTFLFLLSFAILFTIKIVGALLVTSMIIIPAVAARVISTTPFGMIINSLIVAITMSISGIILSVYADMPFAPVIIISGGAVYLLLFVVSKISKKFAN